MQKHIFRGNAKFDYNAVYDVKKGIEVIPLRRIYHTWGEYHRELRLSYGLHHKKWCQTGLTAAMAFTPPKYKQAYHKHLKANEFTICLNEKVHAVLKHGKKTKRISLKPGELAHFYPESVHTITNPYDKTGLNATVKIPIAFVDFRKVSPDQVPKKGNMRKLKPLIQKKPWGKKYVYYIADRKFSYVIEFFFLKKGKILDVKNRCQTFMFVPRGEIKLGYDGLEKRVPALNLIVAKANKHFTLKNISRGNDYVFLYRVYEQK